MIGNQNTHPAGGAGGEAGQSAWVECNCLLVQPWDTLLAGVTAGDRHPDRCPVVLRHPAPRLQPGLV